MSCKRLFAAAAFAATLSACNTATPNRHIGDADPFMGEAVRHNSAMMIINPDPVYPADSAQPGDNGDKMANAVKRYRTDKVKAVETQNTSTSGFQTDSQTPK
ncbi:MAG TPA: hypothetical protein VNR68_01015 [Sphingomicrobium sp.]|nr:hypothetical protein [Sphingomicrobium sp.]